MPAPGLIRGRHDEARGRHLFMHGHAQAGRPQRARLRKEAGLTQEQLAERCGLSQQYLSKLERGRRNPIVVTLYELATALGVSHVELVRPD
ncbi:MAG TPA: helix-turn-helix transcriptional regulator [Allosphingosinicella sp.]|nr:helix-turn-helix transcriptional regulator [Allosphingosinicella sp.]